MGAFIDRTGEIYRDLQITQELGGGKVICKCTKCDHIDTYNKSAITSSLLKCKKCGVHESRVDRTGEVHRTLKIIKELGNSRVMCECIKCNHEDNYNKNYVLDNTALCRKCKGDKPHNFIDRTGKTYGNLKIVKELGEDKVICKCLRCNKEETYTKRYVIDKKTSCKFCERNKIKVDRTGQIFKGLEITKELGNQKVICKCLKCGDENEYKKRLVVASKAACTNCGIPIHRDRTGEVINGLEIIQELGNSIVVCRCNTCQNENNYDKTEVVNSKVRCKSCGMGKGYRGTCINDITVFSLAYTGRDNKRYYNCECSECGEKLVLTREEILSHTCNKG